MEIKTVKLTDNPIVTFTRDVTFHLGGEEISVVHIDPAHTDGDSFVRFRKANLLHLGDGYLSGSFPVADSTNGGTFTGVIAAADTALGMLDAQTRIIPGHGPIARGPDLKQWRDAGHDPRACEEVGGGRPQTGAGEGGAAGEGVRGPLSGVVRDVRPRRRGGLPSGRLREVELHRYDTAPQARRLQIPTLALTGEHDFIPVEIAERIARAIPKATFVTIKDCGHFTSLESPGEVRQALDAFFRLAQGSPPPPEPPAARGLRFRTTTSARLRG